jgi:hypothetical protein
VSSSDGKNIEEIEEAARVAAMKAGWMDEFYVSCLKHYASNPNETMRFSQQAKSGKWRQHLIGRITG